MELATGTLTGISAGEEPGGGTEGGGGVPFGREGGGDEGGGAVGGGGCSLGGGALGGGGTLGGVGAPEGGGGASGGAGTTCVDVELISSKDELVLSPIRAHPTAEFLRFLSHVRFHTTSAITDSVHSCVI